MSRPDIKIDAYIPGDILTFSGDLDYYRVVKVWQSKDGEGYQWRDYDIDGRSSGQRRYLSVERDDGEWVVGLYEQRPPPDDLPGLAELPASLTLDGVAYRRAERGQATITLVAAEGLEGGEPPLAYRYADYAGPAGALLSLEIYGGRADPAAAEIELYVGRELPPAQLQLYGIAQRLTPAARPALALSPALIIGAVVVVVVVIGLIALAL
jgi:Domain of unknown function (DUF4178)